MKIHHKSLLLGIIFLFMSGIMHFYNLNIIFDATSFFILSLILMIVAIIIVNEKTK